MPTYIIRFFALLIINILGACFLITTSNAQENKYPEMKWEELSPASWHPENLFSDFTMQDLNDLEDNDKRAEELLDRISKEWKKAPVNQELNGKKIKIAGFIAPLDWEKEGELREFLLVPYFGACIHYPPPPANQIVYVKMDKPLKDIQSMETVMVYGKLIIEKHDSGTMGASGYSIVPEKVEKYEIQGDGY